VKTDTIFLVSTVAIAIGFGVGLAVSHLHNHGVVSAAAAPTGPLAHVRSEFHFTAHAPMAVAAPLFGPEGERTWGGAEWDPIFLYPQPAKDIERAVFLVQHGQHKSTWVATTLDFAAAHVQYVNVIDGVMATWIDIHLAPVGPNDTAATVVYERTALQPEFNEHVKTLANNDSDSGLHWGSAINGYLKSKSQPNE
jgi:hypothetical protein